jgi:hypothetical protein
MDIVYCDFVASVFCIFADFVFESLLLRHRPEHEQKTKHW